MFLARPEAKGMKQGEIARIRNVDPSSVYPLIWRHSRNQATLFFGGGTGKRDGIACPLRAASKHDLR